MWLASSSKMGKLRTTVTLNSQSSTDEEAAVLRGPLKAKIGLRLPCAALLSNDLAVMDRGCSGRPSTWRGRLIAPNRTSEIVSAPPRGARQYGRLGAIASRHLRSSRRDCDLSNRALPRSETTTRSKMQRTSFRLDHVASLSESSSPISSVRRWKSSQRTLKKFRGIFSK
jgi:hypothetical protein